MLKVGLFFKVEIAKVIFVVRLIIYDCDSVTSDKCRLSALQYNFVY